MTIYRQSGVSPTIQLHDYAFIQQESPHCCMRLGVECRRIIPHCPRVIWNSHLEQDRSCVDHGIGNLGLGGRRHHSALVSSLRQTRWRNFGTTMRPLAERAHTNLGVRCETRFRGICRKCGVRIHVGCSEQRRRNAGRNHLFSAKEAVFSFLIVLSGGFSSAGVPDRRICMARGFLMGCQG